MTATPARTATFRLRQPRQVQGFREELWTASSVDADQEPGDVEAGSIDAGDVEPTAAPDATEQRRPPALTLLWIPPGRFWMGSPPEELERQVREGPQRLVQLPGFFMGQTPITQAQWRAVVQTGGRPGERWGRKLKPDPSRFGAIQGQDSAKVRLLAGEANTDQRPVESVSWHDAMEFCRRLSKRTGRYYTLPSEAQWEYACRAGTSTPFHFGPTLRPELANYDGTFSYADGPRGAYRGQTTPVGMFAANAWGLYDMHGNVLEWCLDHWHGSYEGAPTDGSAWLDGAGDEEGRLTKDQTVAATEPKDLSKLRLLRGGSWGLGPTFCRSAYRSPYRPGFAVDVVGFRVVCLPQAPSLNP